MTKRTNNTNNETTKREQLRDLLLDRYAFGFDLDAQESFLGFVDDLISNIDIAEYDESRDSYDSFDEFVQQYTADLFMWNSDAISFICEQAFDDDGADILDECGVNPFRDPNCFACFLFEHMLYEYIDFEKLEAYVRQQA